jgi:hypothetical protein
MPPSPSAPPATVRRWRSASHVRPLRPSPPSTPVRRRSRGWKPPAGTARRAKARAHARRAPGRAEMVEMDAFASLAGLQAAGVAPCNLLLIDPPHRTEVDDIEAVAARWVPLALAHGRWMMARTMPPDHHPCYQQRPQVGPKPWAYSLRESPGVGPIHGLGGRGRPPPGGSGHGRSGAGAVTPCRSTPPAPSAARRSNGRRRGLGGPRHRWGASHRQTPIGVPQGTPLVFGPRRHCPQPPASRPGNLRGRLPGRDLGRTVRVTGCRGEVVRPRGKATGTRDLAARKGVLHQPPDDGREVLATVAIVW